MDDFVWIRVVTPEWEYTERVGGVALEIAL